MIGSPEALETYKPLPRDLALVEARALGYFADGPLPKKDAEELFWSIFPNWRNSMFQLFTTTNYRKLVKPLYEKRGGRYRAYYDLDKWLVIAQIGFVVTELGVKDGDDFPWNEIDPRLRESLEGTRLFSQIGAEGRVFRVTEAKNQSEKVPNNSQMKVADDLEVRGLASNKGRGLTSEGFLTLYPIQRDELLKRPPYSLNVIRGLGVRDMSWEQMIEVSEAVGGLVEREELELGQELYPGVFASKIPFLPFEVEADLVFLIGPVIRNNDSEDERKGPVSYATCTVSDFISVLAKYVESIRQAEKREGDRIYFSAVISDVERKLQVAIPNQGR